MSQRESTAKNAIYNVAKTGVSVIAPLITYSYVSRLLGAVNLGKLHFQYP